MWIFDTSDGDPRLLRFRSGNCAPPLCISFYANGRHILSAGEDRAFRLFSVIQVWDFKGRGLKSRWEIGCAVVKIVYHRSNGAAYIINFGLLFIKSPLFLSIIVQEKTSANICIQLGQHTCKGSLHVRNKPIEPPKKAEKAPFFLPSAPTLSGQIVFEPSDISSEKKIAEGDKLENRRSDLPHSQFLQLLQSSAEKKSFSAFTNYIKSLSSSTLDVELRMLQIIDDDNEQGTDTRPDLFPIELLLDYFIHETSCGINFEFIQAVIRLFLKIDGETIRRQSSLQDKAKELLEVQYAVWQRVDKLFQSSRCMITF